ncbi:MAG: MMPL family transporter [Deltaproteobacteria bacterium]|nr:MMPL family transporter [Deltaproteobacteria bacterium]
MERRPDQRARSFVAWARRRSTSIIVAHLVLTVIAGYLCARHLPIYPDFSHLLPDDSPAVRDLRRLEARLAAGDSMLVVVEATASEGRAAAIRELEAAIAALPPELVARVEGDDPALRAFVSARRHMFVPLAELERADTALREHIRAAKLRANPIFIDLEHDPAAEQRDKRRLEELREARRRAEARLERPLNVTEDGRIATLQVRTPFRGTDVARGRALLDALGEIRDRVTAAHPGVQVGFTGQIVTAVAEHRAIFKGMVMSSLITTLLVALVLGLYFRSATLIVLLVIDFVIGTVLAFGLAAVTVGHLNSATAFLGALIAGNGVNVGILLVARMLEERRAGAPLDDALATAVHATFLPTLVAALGASIAYGSLAATSFRGFADFALIGGAGMMVCWIVTFSFTVPLIARFGRTTRTHDSDPLIGAALARMLGFRNPKVVGLVALAGFGLTTALTVRFITDDPFEYDIKKLRSEGDDAAEARHWMAVSDANFGRGITARTYIAAEDLADVPRIVAALRKRNDGVAEPNRVIGKITSILDVVPEDQPAKLKVLASLRKQLDDPALEALEPSERNELRSLRPPDDLAEIKIADIPASVRQQLTERDGRVGYIVAVRPHDLLDEWNGRDLIRFADAVRSLDLGEGTTVTTSGSSVIFSDIVDAITSDGTRITLLAAGVTALMVILIVGINRRAAAVLVSTAAGASLMIAMCSTVGLKINFLDFVSLPVTIGLGIDYGINIAHRHDHADLPDAATTLRTSGAAVFMCSLTTVIGYGSLLSSDNLAIRGFGTASLIGELSCLFAALVLVPVLLSVGRRRRR